MYKCLNSDVYYEHKDEDEAFFRGNVCLDDPHYYQACDNRLGGNINNNEKLICEYYLCDLDGYEKGATIFTSRQLIKMGYKCDSDAKWNCTNTRLYLQGCESDNKIVLPSGEVALKEDICNEVCDNLDCEDESVCKGYRYGVYCEEEEKGELETIYVPPKSICDSKQDCVDNSDEENCEATEKTTNCRHVETKQLVPVHNYTRCGYIDKSAYIDVDDDNQPYCVQEDIVWFQTNCTDSLRVGVSCLINGYKSTVSKFLICYKDGISVCDDMIDSTCYTTKTCKIHKHNMCDGEYDCQDKTDEDNPVCNSNTTETCTRRVGSLGELPIPTSWLGDGIWDCENGIDETEAWPICGSQERGTWRYKSRSEEKCKEVFKCRFGKPGYVKLDKLCDGIETCGNENEICSVSSRTHDVQTTVQTTDKGLSKHLSFCLKGLEGLQQLKDGCEELLFIFPEGDIFGVEARTSITLPNSTTQDCDHMYGENYLYTSCTHRCINSSCPLKIIPKYAVCPNQYPTRIGTLVNNQYLAFFTRSYGNILTNRYFVCDNKIKCIDYSQVCDLVDDCGDSSDEKYCTNHFQCNSGKFIAKTKKCDGMTDCLDMSDECNDNCSKEILEGVFLKVLSWSIGILAILANMTVIGKSVRTLRRCKTTVALINRLLIILIALGDLLVGIYLFTIAIKDTEFKREFCEHVVGWATSIECLMIGLLSTIGSQLSLFSMTVLSIVRMHGILKSMNIPGEITVKKAVKVYAGILLLILAAVTIAVIPVPETFEDYFGNGLEFPKEIKIFVGKADKATVFAVLEAYYGRAKETTLKWETLTKMVTNMFSDDYDDEDPAGNVSPVGFYGDDGTCLFKYFVKRDDPQRSFVWSILAVNFVCFVIISVSYILIGVTSHGSSKSLTSSQNNKQITQRNKRMNQKITVIITTDFLCWMPFIVICILHSIEVVDATKWYSVFSMVILPINSVINPLLYDDTVTKVVKAPFSALLRRITSMSMIQEVGRESEATPKEKVGGEGGRRGDMEMN